MTLGDFIPSPRHHNHGLKVQNHTSIAWIDSWDKNPFKASEHGAEPPRAHKELNKPLELKKASINMKTSNDINWIIMEPIITY